MTKKFDGDDEDVDLLTELMNLKDEDLNNLTDDELEMKLEEEFLKIEKKYNLEGKEAPKKKFKKQKEKEKIIITIEEYAHKLGTLTAVQDRAMKEYKTAAFPELYENNKYSDDVDSKTPLLALSRPARVFSSLLQIEIQNSVDKKKKVN
jgi:hypothetical protein